MTKRLEILGKNKRYKMEHRGSIDEALETRKEIYLSIYLRINN